MQKKSVWQRADFLLLLLVFSLAGLLTLRFGSDVEGLTVREVEPAGELLQQEGAPVADHLPKPPEAGEPVRFLMYNVQNYFVAGEKSRSRYMCRPKSVRSREAVADVIATAAPEIVGLIEIGGELALADLQKRLAERGLRYSHAMVLEREGEDRALALLSMHPVIRDSSQANYPLYGQKRRKMLRGILDVTVQLPDGRYFRVMGAHLKSRVAQDAAAANNLRSREARTLAFYLHEQVQRAPEVPIVLFGDWNDGPEDASLGVLTHGLSRQSSMSRLEPLDDRGHAWTIYFKAGSEYLVFDQIYVNPILKRRRGRHSQCGIVDIDAASTASDHRAIWCELR